ncbi:MAG TPA: AMP-binding protein, partial [Solirubrobacteraceae bacterium]|nr:AMP-binding protein [Solirubrobacteraceae bacterium]
MLLDTLSTKALTVRTLIECGMFAPTRPDKLVRALKAFKDWGPTTAAGYSASAIRYPSDVSIIDDAGSLTFGEVHRRTNALAHAWSDEGIVEGDNIALLCRNHRGFVEAMVACSKLGAHALFLNTAFAGPQLTEVCDREQPKAIVYDEEFEGLIAGATPDARRFVAWTDSGRAPAGADLLETLIERGDPRDVVVPATKGKIVILTSGTTGTPKGANRKQPQSLDPVAGLIEKIPLRARGRTLISAPLFHSWGLAHFILGIGLSSTLILRRRFDPEDALSAIDEHGATALIVVPVMLQRMLELGPKTIGRYDTGSLRVIAASGSALPGELATKVLDTFGDVLYNLYGSTEVAWATIATPEDLRAAPGTAGRPPRGTVVRLYDADEREVAPGETGRIFVGSELAFEGYSGGGNKQFIDGMMSSGDVGHFDEGGRLFVDGRDDEMIVSGGENVFPREVEDTIACLEGIEEVAAVGVEDDQFGQRLKAFVVVSDGATISEQDVKAHVKANLARYKVPRDV